MWTTQTSEFFQGAKDKSSDANTKRPPYAKGNNDAKNRHNNSQKAFSKQGANRVRTSQMKKRFWQSKRLQARSTGINEDIDDEEDYDQRY